MKVEMRNTMLWSVLTVLILLAWKGSGPVDAGEYAGRHFFVDQGHPEACDGNAGTEAEPWLTISGNRPQLRAGDTVHVKKGTYREEVILTGHPFYGNPVIASGESYSRMISFAAWPGHEVVIKGSDVVTGWERYRDDIWVRREWPYNSQQVFVDGELLRQTAGKIIGDPEARSGLMYFWFGRKGEGLDDLEAGSFYYDLDEKALYLWLDGGGDPNDRLVEASVRPFLFVVRGLEYIRISGFRMMHSNTSVQAGWGAVMLGSHCILEEVEVTWTDFTALSPVTSNNTVVNSRFNYNGNTGISGSGRGHRFINCETSHNNYRFFGKGHHAGGVKLVGFPYDITFQGHTAAHNRGCGIWFDWGMSQVTIQDSVAHDNEGHGIFYEAGERAVIMNNIAYRNHQRGIYLACSSDSLVAHNLALENGLSGIVVTGTSRGAGRHQIGREEDNILWVRNNVVRGNILVNNGYAEVRRPRHREWGDRAELILPDERPTNENNTSDYNLFHRSDGRNVLLWIGYHVDGYDDLTAWQEGTGNDRHSVIADPLFVDREGGDFRLRPDSPAIGLVRPHMAVRFDFDGRPRHRRAEADAYHAAGPFEFQAD